MQRATPLETARRGHLFKAPAVPTGWKGSMDRAEVKEAMGTWLGELAPWDHFATWTFSRPVTVNGAMHWGRRHLVTLGQRAELPLYGFIAAEKGNRGGLIHIHALLGNTGALLPYCRERLRPGEWGKSCCMTHSWPCGIARVFSYNPKLGAKHYVSKYIVKELAEWELFGNPLQAQKPLDFKVSIVEAVKHEPQKEGQNARCT